MQRSNRTSPVVTGLILAAGVLAIGLPTRHVGASGPHHATSPARAARIGGAGGPLRDGNWAGTMAVGATVDFSSGSTGVVAQGSGNGSFHLLLAGGTASGDFTFGVTSTSTLEGAGTTGEATAVGAISGALQGTATGPIFQPQQAHFDVAGSVTVDGVSVPFDVPLDFGPEEMTSSMFVIAASSCSYASGTWAQEFQAAVESAGGSVTAFQGSWAAQYGGGAPAEANAALTDLLSRGEAILSSWFATGTFDADSLEVVMVDAEHLAAAVPVADGCGDGTTGEWASPVAGLVERLLTAMASSPSTTAENIRFGVAAGLRTGVLPSIDSPLEGALLTKAGELLDTAIAAADATSIVLLSVTADSMAWSELSAEANGALGL